MNETLVEIFKNVMLASTGGAVGWFFTKRNTNAQASLTEGDAILKMQEGYKNFVSDSNEKFEEMQQKINELHKNIDLIRAELEECIEKYKKPAKKK